MLQVLSSVQVLLERNLKLKLAIKTLEQEEFTLHGQSIREYEGNWETALFSPLGRECTSDVWRECASLSTPTPLCPPEKVSPQHSLSRGANDSLGSLSVSLISTDVESHCDTDIEDGETEDCNSCHDDASSVRVQVENPEHLLSCPRILNHRMMQYLHNYGLPFPLRDNEWERCFAIGRDGDSFVSFLKRTSRFQQTLIVIQTTEGSILGGFATQSWKVQNSYTNRYYGTGQSFLFSQADPNSEMQIFHWTGVNDFCQICNESEGKIAMGGGGSFGLIVEEGFWRGQTGPCKTYSNPSLVPGGFFEIAAFEVYGLVPFSVLSL